MAKLRLETPSRIGNLTLMSAFVSSFSLSPSRSVPKAKIELAGKVRSGSSSPSGSKATSGLSVTCSDSSVTVAILVTGKANCSPAPPRIDISCQGSSSPVLINPPTLVAAATLTQAPRFPALRGFSINKIGCSGLVLSVCVSVGGT